MRRTSLPALTIDSIHTVQDTGLIIFVASTPHRVHLCLKHGKHSIKQGKKGVPPSPLLILGFTL
jgi:hypothetical protein